MRKRRIAIILMSLAAVLWSSARDVEAAPPSCSVTTAGALAFGTYNVLTTSATDVNGSFSFTCNASRVSVTIDLGPGNAGGNGANPSRFMLGPSSAHLSYNIFTDTSYTKIWGENNGHDVTVTSNATANQATNVQLPGQIPAAVAGGTNDVAAGSYSDSLTLTINF